jgi:hypothetical protein
VSEAEATNDDEFSTSSFSGGGNCVQVGRRPDHVVVRDSKDSSRSPLIFSHAEWVAFIAGVKNNEFDLT